MEKEKLSRRDFIRRTILTAAVVLVPVTVLSFGIRHVRVSIYRVRNAASAQGPVSNGAGPGKYSAYKAVVSGENTQRQNRLDFPLEQYQQDGDSEAADAMADSQDAGEFEQAAASAERSDAWEHPGKRADVVFTGKAFKGDYSKFKGDYAKDKGSKGFQKISIGEYENVYITDKGEHWYVTELPDGSTTKMQLQEVDGELQPIGKENVYRSEGGKDK